MSTRAPKHIGGYDVNVRDKARMFKSDFIERFSHTPGLTPLFLFGPLSIICLVMAFTQTPLSAGSVILAAVSGVVFWTFAEYWLHRKLFHFRKFPRIHFILHGVHHEFPNDTGRLVMPPVAALIGAAPIALLFYAVLGLDLAYPALGGFMIGYVWYEMTHLWTHVGKPKTAYGKHLKRHHMLHHFQTPEKRFGVSTPIWDFVFGTYVKHEKPAREAASTASQQPS